MYNKHRIIGFELYVVSIILQVKLSKYSHYTINSTRFVWNPNRLAERASAHDKYNTSCIQVDETLARSFRSLRNTDRPI